MGPDEVALKKIDALPEDLNILAEMHINFPALGVGRHFTMYCEDAPTLDQAIIDSLSEFFQQMLNNLLLQQSSGSVN